YSTFSHRNQRHISLSVKVMEDEEDLTCAFYSGPALTTNVYASELPIGLAEDEDLWIASRLIWFDQPRPPDSSQTAPVKIGPSS
ncbi:hypothetical protein STEG23_023920, partial [Scotinomys teguina]